MRRESINLQDSGVVLWPSYDAFGSSSDLDVLMVTTSIHQNTIKIKCPLERLRDVGEWKGCGDICSDKIWTNYDEERKNNRE